MYRTCFFVFKTGLTDKVCRLSQYFLASDPSRDAYKEEEGHDHWSTCVVVYKQWIYISSLETVPTTEAAFLKFCLDVICSIRTKMGIIKSVLIKAFMQKKNNFFLYKLIFYRIVSFLINSVPAICSFFFVSNFDDAMTH